LSKRDSELYKYQKMLNNIAIQAEILDDGANREYDQRQTTYLSDH